MLALVTVASKWAFFAGYLAGVALVAWIAVQLLVLQRYFFLQPVIACLGVLQVALARAWQRKTGTAGRRGGQIRSARPPAEAGDFSTAGRMCLREKRWRLGESGTVVDALGAVPFYARRRTGIGISAGGDERGSRCVTR